MNLQLALDFTSYDEALAVAKEVEQYVDLIEAGSPLIKSEGLEVVTKLTEEFPDKLIVADMKTADLGDLEVQMAEDAQADMMTVLGGCPFETVKTTVAKAKELGDMKIIIDLLGVSDIKKRLRQLEDVGPDYILIHTGIDEQIAGVDPLHKINEAAKLSNFPLIVAGGINEALAQQITNIDNIDIVIVGSAITKSMSPVASARTIKETIQHA